mgnify:CR=1 FL=1
MRIGFDNEKYIALQAEHIRERISQFGGKLNSEVNCLTISMPHAYCQALSPTAKFVCSSSS